MLLSYSIHYKALQGLPLQMYRVQPYKRRLRLRDKVSQWSPQPRPGSLWCCAVLVPHLCVFLLQGRRGVTLLLIQVAPHL